jgi:hypothetical protein
MGIPTSQRSIADLGPWDFWARPDSLGLQPDDLAAVEGGTALPDQINRMKALCECARHNLITAEVNEPRRPS